MYCMCCVQEWEPLLLMQIQSERFHSKCGPCWLFSSIIFSIVKPHTCTSLTLFATDKNPVSDVLFGLNVSTYNNTQKSTKRGELIQRWITAFIMCSAVLSLFLLIPCVFGQLNLIIFSRKDLLNIRQYTQDSFPALSSKVFLNFN